MALNLPSGEIGTDPKTPQLADLDWLKMQADYDNYPSDNQSVRVTPQLSDLWNHNPLQGVRIIPNTKVMPLGLRSGADAEAIAEVVREAKKACMMGYDGAKIAEYLRSRFTEAHITAAKEHLGKIAEEMGLLGNVYIDVSAFKTQDEAEKFLGQHRGRLAQFMVMGSSDMNRAIVENIASKFHKTLVASVTYDNALFNKYQDHLVVAGRIPKEFTVDSKEALRQAFLYVKPVVAAEPSQPKQEKKMSSEEIEQGLQQIAESRQTTARETRDSLLAGRINPVISFVQENLSKGKTGSDLKDMIRARFTPEDVKNAAAGIALALSQRGLTASHIDEVVASGKISSVLGEILKKIGKKFPVRAAKIEEKPRSQSAPVGIVAQEQSLNVMRKSADTGTLRDACGKALRSGIEPNKVFAKLCEKVSQEEANGIFSEAMADFNASPAGVTANRSRKSKKQALFIEPAPRQTLPDPSTIPGQVNEITSFFAGRNTDIDVKAYAKPASIEIGELFNMSGLDQVIE